MTWFILPIYYGLEVQNKCNLTQSFCGTSNGVMGVGVWAKKQMASIPRDHIPAPDLLQVWRLYNLCKSPKSMGIIIRYGKLNLQSLGPLSPVLSVPPFHSTYDALLGQDPDLHLDQKLQSFVTGEPTTIYNCSVRFNE